MKDNKLIPYKKNIFTKIINFFKNLFVRKEEIAMPDTDDKTVDIMAQREKFVRSIEIKEDEEDNRLKAIQLQYDNGEIDEDDISEEDIDKLVEMYEKETDELNADTEKRKRHIAKMLEELKRTS